VHPLRRFYYLLDSRRFFVLARQRSREQQQHVNEHESQVVQANLKREHVAIFRRLHAGSHSFEHQLRLPRSGLSLAKAAVDAVA
jgi:hypothetical protein